MTEMTAEMTVPKIAPNLSFAGLQTRWAERPFEFFRDGIEVSWLLQGGADAPSAALLRYQPGARVPRHRHAGLETILVLEGTQSDDHGDYGAGTLIINPVDTDHEVWTREGCVVLVQWNLPVVFLEEGR